jgi:site-specific DNA recombinase
MERPTIRGPESREQSSEDPRAARSRSGVGPNHSQRGREGPRATSLFSCGVVRVFGHYGQALKGRWNGGRPYGYRLRPILDHAQRNAYGQPARIGTMLDIDPKQAPVVKQIFTRYAEGASFGVIARELNAARVPSPGSTWKRQTRRCKGWLDSAVRVIIKSRLYTGRLHWNTSKFVRDPDSGK